MRNVNLKRKSMAVFIVAIVVIFIFQTIASKLGGLIARNTNYSTIDSYNIFAFISIHHIVQMLIALAAILFIKKALKLQFNLKSRYSKIGIKYTMFFTAAILIYVLASYSIGYKLGTVNFYDYPLSVTNVVGTLGFQLLLSGPSEEILFRALPITILLYLWNKGKGNNPIVSIVCSSALFAAAHITWGFSPFTIQIDWFQLIYAFILGLAYAVTYIKSKSIIYPMIMHSMSNFLMVGVGYLVMTV